MGFMIMVKMIIMIISINTEDIISHFTSNQCIIIVDQIGVKFGTRQGRGVFCQSEISFFYNGNFPKM